MDLMLITAGQALAQGDPLGALKYVALREDAPALALRGIAMAQLGDFARAKTLLYKATRRFGAQNAVARARCTLAIAEIDLATRNLNGNPAQLATARHVLTTQGDHVNAAHAQFLEAQRLLLIGKIQAAEQALSLAQVELLPVALQATHAFATANLAMRKPQAHLARSALTRAASLARQAGIPALIAEIEHTFRQLNTTAARLITQGEVRDLLLDDVETLFASSAFIVDACRYRVCCAGEMIELATRPLLFSLVRLLADAWPSDTSRESLITNTFRLKQSSESLRARLRVEIGRLRKLLAPIAEIHATSGGFVLKPSGKCKVVVLAQPVENKYGALLALLADGEAWSSSALALALNTHQRKVQRALDTLANEGKITTIGRGRARRWLSPSIPAFTTFLLLPTPTPYA